MLLEFSTLVILEVVMKSWPDKEVTHKVDNEANIVTISKEKCRKKSCLNQICTYYLDNDFV